MVFLNLIFCVGCFCMVLRRNSCPPLKINKNFVKIGYMKYLLLTLLIIVFLLGVVMVVQNSKDEAVQEHFDKPAPAYDIRNDNHGKG